MTNNQFQEFPIAGVLNSSQEIAFFVQVMMILTLHEEDIAY